MLFDNSKAIYPTFAKNKKKMKALKPIIVTLIFSLSITLNLVAKENVNNRSPSAIDLRRHKNKPSRFPRMPSNQCLEFYYFSDTQECQFTFNYDIESLSVTIVEISTGAIYMGEVSQESPVMYQALPSGDYHITCITDEGDTYEGEGNIQ